MLVTDHNVRETLRITDRAYIIADGKIFRSGPPAELEKDPEVRKVYLGESFSLQLAAMALQQKLTQRLSQRLVMTPALQMAIKLLQLNKLELEQTLQQEMVENPILEDSADDARSDVEEVGDEPPDRAEPEPEPEPEAGWRRTDRRHIRFSDALFEKLFDSQPSTPNMREEREGQSFEATLTATPSLLDHLMWQLEMTELDGDGDIVQAVLGNLDDDGYMRASVDEVAAMGGWRPIDVERAVATVQSLDPPGVGARDLGECLFLQLEHLGLDR